MLASHELCGCALKCWTTKAGGTAERNGMNPSQPGGATIRFCIIQTNSRNREWHLSFFDAFLLGFALSLSSHLLWERLAELRRRERYSGWRSPEEAR